MTDLVKAKVISGSLGTAFAGGIGTVISSSALGF